LALRHFRCASLYPYRITKYDPALRDERGTFLGNDWTSRSDIGKAFDGKALTEAEYLRTEANYLASIDAFFREAGIRSLVLRQLETRENIRLPHFVRGAATLDIPQCIKFVRLALREQVWGMLATPRGAPRRAFLHVGYDFYLYLGVPTPCAAAVKNAQERGLFVEQRRSPYLRLREDGTP
jgi:hypothetical protein